MKKTFKKAIACLLTVLMIVCSLPFTALAGQTKYYDYQHEYNYQGYNELGMTVYDADMGEERPYVSLFDFIPIDHAGDERMLMDNYTPTVGIIVQSIGNSKMGDFTAAKNQNNVFYRQNKTYQQLKDEGLLLNPAELKAGQRIAVTLEVGGMDTLYIFQQKFKWDESILKTAYYSGVMWRKGVNTNSVKNAPASIEPISGAFTSQILQEQGLALIAVMSAHETDAAYIGDYYRSVAEDYGVENMGTYGVIMGTLCFEVQQDCDLTEVLQFNMDDVAHPHQNCFIQPYSDEQMKKYFPDHKMQFAYGAEETGYVSPTYIWDNYSKASTSVDYTYTMADGTSTTVTAEAGATPTAPANTAPVVAHVADTQTHTTTTYTWPAFDANVTEYTEVATVSDPQACDFTENVTVEPTFTTPGSADYTCKVCGYTETRELPKNECVEHAWGEWEETTPASCDTAGVKTRTCANCGATETEAIPATGHSWGEWVETTPATCTAKGVDTRTCSVCDATETRESAMLDHAWDEGVVTKAATCVAEGVKTFTCAVGGETKTEAIAIDAANHAGPTEVQNAKPASCTAEGYTGDTVCKACGVTVTNGETIPMAAHTAGTPVQENVVEATYETPGSYDLVTRCTVCNAVMATEKVTVPVLDGGIAITVKASALGTSTIADKEVTTTDVTKTVAPKSDVVLTATPAAGATFVGWNANGKMVSTDATITVKALNVVTYEPIFETSATDKFTVVFTDKYGNVIKTQTVADGTEIEEPTAPTIAGHTFANWSMTAEEIDALTAAATITAVYEKDAETMYTVTATDGATVNGAESVQVPYDTAVTVTATDAKAWKIGDATVAYGDTYTFYVGADVTVTPVFELITAQAPVVTAVSTSVVTAANGLKAASFLATRSMTDDCTYVNAGFIYGKDLAKTEIELGDVDGSAVKVKYCATTAEQFALTYGATAQTGVLTARAFLAYVDAQGNTQVTYAAPQTYTY